jgi:hypothetical protein
MKSWEECREMNDRWWIRILERLSRLSVAALSIILSQPGHKKSQFETSCTRSHIPKSWRPFFCPELFYPSRIFVAFICVLGVCSLAICRDNSDSLDAAIRLQLTTPVSFWIISQKYHLKSSKSIPDPSDECPVRWYPDKLSICLRAHEGANSLVWIVALNANAEISIAHTCREKPRPAMWIYFNGLWILRLFVRVPWLDRFILLWFRHLFHDVGLRSRMVRKWQIADRSGRIANG